MPVKHRLIKYIKFKGISIRAFCRASGLSESYVTSIRNSIQPDKLDMIAHHFPDLNVGWVVTGDGEMLRGNTTLPPIEREVLIEAGAEIFKEKLIEMFKAGEIYSASVVNEQNTIIRDLYQKLIRLEEEVKWLKDKIIQLESLR